MLFLQVSATRNPRAWISTMVSAIDGQSLNENLPISTLPMANRAPIKLIFMHGLMEHQFHSNILNTWTAVYHLINLPSIYYPSNYDFLCHVEILDRLCARWSSRNRHAGPCIAPPTFQIHPNGNKNKCLDVRRAVFENNSTPANMSVIIFLCDN